MGRLVVRALAHHEQLEITHINELNCDAKLLLTYAIRYCPWNMET